MPCIYTVKNAAGEEISFNTKEEALRYLRDNDVAETSVKGDPSRTTETLANVLRQVAFGENNYNPQQLRVFQEELLDEFIRLEEQSQFFYKMGSAIALTKGLGKNFDQMTGVMKNLSDLGIGKTEEEFKAPIDVRYLLTGDSQYRPDDNPDAYHHKITANNVRIMNEIYSLSKTIFMEQSPSFINTSDKVIANLGSSVTNSVDKVREVKDDLTAFYQIAAYKQWIEINDKKTSTLRNSLIYDSEGNTPTIVDIVKEANRLAPTNTFLQFILPVNTTVKVGKKKVKNINNKDLINTIEGKTRGKLEPDLIATLMDSFTELYQNPQTQYHAKALFDYLIVKDGLMFKNKSFIKMVPTLMFKEVSNATDLASELLSLSQRSEFSRFIKKINALEIVDREGNYKSYFTNEDKQRFNELFRSNDLLGIKNKLHEKIFGLNYSQLYNRFEQIYATDVKYQFNLDFIRTKIRGTSGTKAAQGISFGEEDGRKYMHVGMFTEKFKATEVGSEERSKVFSETMDDLSSAGFGFMELEDGNKNLLFKKFVRIQEAKGYDPMTGQSRGVSYKTYQLVSVERKVGNRYERFSGTAMTAEGELIPRGVYAVYAPVEAVGTSNSSGVADLGVRPTKEQIIRTLNEKIRRDGGQNPPPAPPTPPATPIGPVTPTTPTTPTSGETIQGGMFGGMQLMAFDPNNFDLGGMNISDDEINDTLKGLDKC